MSKSEDVEETAGQFWLRLSKLLTVVARTVYDCSDLLLDVEADDLAQNALEAAIRWSTRNQTDLTYDNAEFKEDIRKYAGACLRNDYLSEVKKARRRWVKLLEHSALSSEIEGTHSIVRSRVDRPDEILQAKQLADKAAEMSKLSRRYEKIAQAVSELASNSPSTPTPADIADMSGLSSSDVDDWRRMLSRKEPELFSAERTEIDG